MTAPVREGDVLAGKYCVERVIGRGGMGVVVAARHIQLGQKVALKFMLAEACENADAVARFLREAQAAFQIQSEHVARILDMGTLDGGAPFMVMEFLNGCDLGDVIRDRGPLPIAEAVGYLLQACEAIAEAHSRGIVHRDLKPSNLFLSSRADGSALIKVLDFGISKGIGGSALDVAAPSVTATATIMGSPSYMSPEQVRSSKHVDARTDIWALGVVIHQLVSGRLPFEGDTLGAIMAMIAADPPVPLRSVRADAPAELERLVLRCLEKDPSRRIPNVAELALGLQPFGPQEGRLSVERVTRLLKQSGTMTSPPEGWKDAVRETTASSWGATGAVATRRPWLAIGAIGGVLAIGAVAMVALHQGPPAPAAERGVAASAAGPPAAVPIPVAPVQSVPAPSVLDGGSASAASSVAPPAVEPSAEPGPATVRRLPTGGPEKGRRVPAPRHEGADDLFNDTR
jgi:eukaryotic-like serine/threonine-protein kinase